jgi:uncharacterized membrane protein HdeD (DUF308 family)
MFTGLASIALGIVLFIRPDIGVVTLATVFGLFSVVYGVSAVVLSLRDRAPGSGRLKDGYSSLE